MLDFIGHQGDADQNHSEVSSHTTGTGTHQIARTTSAGEAAGRKGLAFIAGGLLVQPPWETVHVSLGIP